MVRSTACLAVIVALLGGAASGANAPTIAVSATGTLGVDDTIVIAVSNPSTRVAIEVPEGYAFPRPAPIGGHAFIRYAGGTGERGVIAVRKTPAAPCGDGDPQQIWSLGFTSADVVAAVSGTVMTICGLPAHTTEIVVASKYWSTPQAAGVYVWEATTADGAQATTTIRLPVRLTVAQLARRPVRLRARLTEDDVPIAGKYVHLVVPNRAPLATRTRADGTALFTLRLRRKTTVYAQISLGEQASEAHVLSSNRLTVRP